MKYIDRVEFVGIYYYFYLHKNSFGLKRLMDAVIQQGAELGTLRERHGLYEFQIKGTDIQINTIQEIVDYQSK